MQTHLTFAWPISSEDGERRAGHWSQACWRNSHWSPALREPGLEIWTLRGLRLPVRRISGTGLVVIGDILERGSSRPLVGGGLPGFPDDPVRAARRLASDTWGAYLALLPNANGGWSVFRDPSGALEGLTWRRGDVTALSDGVNALPPDALPAELALDWNVITEITRRPMASSHLSPLSGFHPVSPGDVQALGGATDPVPIWRPASWLEERGPAQHEDLRAAVLSSVDGLAACEPRLLVEVSGGLDSAIVAGALKAVGHGGQVAAALNYYPPQQEGDERHYADAVCRRAGLPLVATPSFAEAITADDFDRFARAAAPAFAAIDPQRDRDTAEKAARLGATALMGGQGGDAIFFQMPTPAVVGDLLGARGWRAMLDPFVIETARWLRMSVWDVLARARRDSGGSVGEPPGVRQFWGRRAREAPALPRHPWLEDLGGVPRGKRLQVEALVVGQLAWNRSAAGARLRLHRPLLAQPVLEAWLPIPTFRLVEGGRDRALARRIFADDLPTAVARRRSKGALTSAYARGTADSLEFLRSHLLDGVLADARVLDRSAMEAALQPDQLIWRNAGARLIRAAIIESWVRYWQTRAPDCRIGARTG